MAIEPVLKTSVNGVKMKASFTYLFFAFLGLHLRHTEFPRIVTESELQLQAYTTVQKHRILNPLSEVRDQTHILISSWTLRQVLNSPSYDGNSTHIVIFAQNWQILASF